MIKSISIIAYIYGLLPLLIGASVTLLAKRQVKFSQMYVTGYVFYLFFFELIVILATHHHASVTDLVRYWKAIVLFLTIFVLCSISISIIRILKNHPHTKILLHLSRESWILAGLTIVVIMLAVFVLVPHAMDDTPELARISLSHDAFFFLNPSTGKPFDNASLHSGCIHLFFAFGSAITGINATSLIHIFMPIFLVPLFVSIYITIAHILFPDQVRSHDRFRFVYLVMLFYALMLPLEAHIAFTPYRNIWNGVTLAASCLLPLFFAICLDLTRCFSVCDLSPVISKQNAVIGLFFLILAVRLCIPYGPVLCVLFVLATILIIFSRVFWRKRSSFNSGSGSKGGGIYDD